jgi:hypothetical protein
MNLPDNIEEAVGLIIQLKSSVDKLTKDNFGETTKYLFTLSERNKDLLGKDYCGRIFIIDDLIRINPLDQPELTHGLAPLLGYKRIKELFETTLANTNY